MHVTQKQVIEILGETFTSKGFVISPDMNLKGDIGFDSLDVIELVLILKSKFDISISDQESDNINSVQDIIFLVDEKLKS